MVKISNFVYYDLTDDVRQNMMNELNMDMNKDMLYLSSNFNDYGKKVYPELLLESIKTGNGYTLQIALNDNNCFLTVKPKKGGGIQKVESNAAQKISQNEFNRYYIRGVCLKAITEEIENVEIYRAKESTRARIESERKIGNLISAKALLEDLRNSIGNDPHILPEIGSGLSIKLPKK